MIHTFPRKSSLVSLFSSNTLRVMVLHSEGRNRNRNSSSHRGFRVRFFLLVLEQIWSFYIRSVRMFMRSTFSCLRVQNEAIKPTFVLPFFCNRPYQCSFHKQQILRSSYHAVSAWLPSSALMRSILT